ncbi:probable ATP-dependent RNA helicase DDX60 [Amphiura filiformis]|uniref:probable ATP-dependent RNA helicase DDX60 n=1 Tax=Amphiura filiformis TaxID=82378 RepID=UPI003B224D6E
MSCMDSDGDESSDSSEDEDDQPIVQMKIYRKAQEACQNLYINAPRIDLNLMHDFTESDLFTIDGDSLLADIFAHKGLDFTHGGQLLHFVYLVEHFLQDFQEREGQFHIIFFTEAESIWHSNPLKLLARRTIIQHLEHNTNCHLITNISHPYSPKWKAYIDQEHPAFVMLSDGESLGRKRRMLIHSLLRASVQYGLDCAFCSAMRRSLRSVNTFYIEARKAGWCCGSLKQDGYLQATASLVRQNAKLYSQADLQRICGQLQSILKKQGSVNLISTCRDVIIVIACAEVMKAAFTSRKDEMDRAFTEGAAQACILQLVLLEYLPLEARAQNIPDDKEVSPFNDGLMESFLKRLHYSMARVMASYTDLCSKLNRLDVMRETGSLADLMDGRLLYATLYLLQKSTEKNIETSFPAEVMKKFQYLWQVAVDLSDAGDENANHLTQLPAAGGDGAIMQAPVHIYKNTSTEMVGNRSLSKRRKGLVQVSAELVTDYVSNRYLLSELTSNKAVNLRSISTKPKQFVENYHWHTGKPLKDDYDNTRDDTVQLSTDPKKRKWQLENNQKFARYMQSYGESLEGRAHGLMQQTITVDKGNAAKSKKVSAKHQGQKKKQVMSGKERILHDKLLKDQATADASAGHKWSNILPDIASDVEAKKYTAAVNAIDNFLDHCSSDKWTTEAMLSKMDCYWIAWKHAKFKTRSEYLTQPSSLFSDLTDAHPMYYPIMLFVCCQEILCYEETLNKNQVKMIGAYMRGLGFESLAMSIKAMECGKHFNFGEGSQKPVFSEKLPDQDECSVGISCTRFQLQFVGQWMKRNEGTDKDPRVPHFIPDTWQRELLDVVDRNESALIVAPTSSGKTYASYYCMEKILRESNDGVVVYVSPTKALMNQVSATIYARFNKKLPGGKVVCGVFSRDFRRNALNCQILVTVPQCLEILLLSPCRQEWAKRIRYVIFDEVHCLGGEIGAEVWEHLLVAISCPFLALSATVRNPQDIRGWLQASQDFKQQQAEEILRQSSRKKAAKADSNAYKVGLVIWEERHSDLEKYVYLPNEFIPVHPVAMLNLTKVKAQGLPSDLTLSPRETLVLYDAMEAAYPACQQIKELEPDVYFQDIPILQKQDARNYERDLKTELMRWIEEEDTADKVETIIGNLKAKLLQHVSDAKKTRGSLWSDRAATRDYAKLIRQLNEQNKLPALAFSQNRNLCERLAERIASSLEDAEERMRARFEARPLWKEVQKIMERLEKEAKRTQDKETYGKKKPANQKLDPNDPDPRSAIHLEVKRTKRPAWRRPGSDDKHVNKSPHVDAERFEACLSKSSFFERGKLLAAKYYLMDDPLPSCTLQGEGNLTKEEIDEILERLPDDDTSNNLRWLISRGVAYHHAGMNNKQRVAVETLFRMKYLKVVSATATLALGIHMPCKTVVFVCEDLWLKPLSFRQMSGRSGRRGYDLVGNVIFFCVPPQKIQHLITSGLPHLRGHFPFSVSFVLRLMVLTHNSQDKKSAHEKALALLKHPFVCYKSQGMEEVVQHFFLFSVDYLIRVGLLEPDGTPISLSGLATHLHYHEPANLTFVSMLQEGVFHNLCQPSRDGSFSWSVMETLVVILAQMFGRITMPMATYKRKKRQGIHSKVVFGKSLHMPPAFAKVLERHNRDAWKVFRRYVHTVCDYAARSNTVKQNVLPLSKVAIQPNHLSPSLSENATGKSNVLKTLQASANQSTTLSPFVMTSGHSDKDLPIFDADILQAIRQGVHIEQTKIPTLIPPSELRDTRGKPVYLNAYVYDFFKHGSKTVIRKENGLDSGDVFDKLKDFKLVIAAISVALEELGPKSDNVVRAFRQLGNEYSKKFKLQYPSYRD